jgi:hypothetical protein
MHCFQEGVFHLTRSVAVSGLSVRSHGGCCMPRLCQDADTVENDPTDRRESQHPTHGRPTPEDSRGATRQRMDTLSFDRTAIRPPNKKHDSPHACPSLIERQPKSQLGCGGISAAGRFTSAGSRQRTVGGWRGSGVRLGHVAPRCDRPAMESDRRCRSVAPVVCSCEQKRPTFLTSSARPGLRPDRALPWRA